MDLYRKQLSRLKEQLRLSNIRLDKEKDVLKVTELLKERALIIQKIKTYENIVKNRFKNKNVYGEITLITNHKNQKSWNF